jgi:hypothetical protein
LHSLLSFVRVKVSNILLRAFMKFVNSKKESVSFLPFLKNPKIFGLITLALVVLVGLPITLYEVSQQQLYQQHANNTYTGGAGDYPCGPVTIKIYGLEHPTCTSGTDPTMTQYSVSAVVGLEKGSTGNYSVLWKWAEFFCFNKNGNAIIDGHTACVSGTGAVTTASSGSIDISSGAQQATTHTLKPPSPYSTCGTYQVDFGFKVVSKTSGATICNYSYDAPNLGYQNSFWASCNTGVSCQIPSPTPTHGITPSPTPTRAPTPTAGITPTDTPPPGVTPTDTPIPTPTPTPTLPPGVTPTDTPTPTPTTPPGTPTQPGLPICNTLTADRSTTGYAPYALTLTGSASSQDNPITKAIFTFGDGQTQTLTQGGTLGSKTASVSTSHSYQQIGNYTASVVFYDKNNNNTGSSNNCNLTIAIITPPPGGHNPTIVPTNPIPSTGPGDTIAAIGVVGALILVLGGLFVFGL